MQVLVALGAAGRALGDEEPMTFRRPGALLAERWRTSCGPRRAGYRVRGPTPRCTGSVLQVGDRGRSRESRPGPARSSQPVSPLVTQRLDLPGGHVEQGESEQQALARQMQEELGVQVLDGDAAPRAR